MARDDFALRPDLDPARHADYKRRDRLLAWPRVRDLYGISRTTAWRLQKVGEFPQPVQISPGRVGWRESELILWAASREHPVERVRSSPLRDKEDAVFRDAPVRQVLSETKPASRPRRRPPAKAAGQTAFEF